MHDSCVSCQQAACNVFLPVRMLLNAPDLLCRGISTACLFDCLLGSFAARSFVHLFAIVKALSHYSQQALHLQCIV